MKFPEKNKLNVAVIQRHRELNKETITWLNIHTCMEVTEPEKREYCKHTGAHTLNDTQSAKNFIMWFCYLLLQFLSFLTSFKQLAIAIPMGISSNNNNNNKKLCLVCIILCALHSPSFFLSLTFLVHTFCYSEGSKNSQKKERSNRKEYFVVFVHTKCIFELYVQLILRVTGSKLLLRLFFTNYLTLTSTYEWILVKCISIIRRGQWQMHFFFSTD